MQAASDKKQLFWFYGTGLLFFVLSIYGIIHDFYWLSAIPAFIAIIYLAIFSLDSIVLFITFCTPLAIVINDKSSGPALSFPTEPLMFGVLLLFTFKFIFEGKFDKRILRHPVTKALYFLIGWMTFTSLTSSYPLVSFKHLLSQLWFIIPFYLFGTQVFRKITNIRKFIWLYAMSLLIVIGYTIYNHAINGWTQKAAHWVMTPFYNDHTAYAAALALFIPPLIRLGTDQEISFRQRFFALVSFVIVTIAIILSYTRAAWLSLVVAFGLYFIYLFRIKFRNVAALMIAVLTLFFSFKSEIFMNLERNRQDSATDFNKHIQSISNISTDASNLERINRWNSAFRMFNDRPVLGWGPGTYQFNYAPYQKADERTIISTNSGDMGNAHSEFIGPLAEQGILGMASMIILVITVIYTGTLYYSKTKNPHHRKWALGILLGLITYFVHGTLNNFLDTDKLAVPFWGFIGMIVALDVYHRDDDSTLEKTA